MHSLMMNKEKSPFARTLYILFFYENQHLLFRQLRDMFKMFYRQVLTASTACCYGPVRSGITAVGMDPAETDRNKFHYRCSLTKIMFVGEDVTITLSWLKNAHRSFAISKTVFS